MTRSTRMSGMALLGAAVLALSLLTAASASAFTVSEKTVNSWMSKYLHDWETKDAEDAMTLFTPDAVYQANATASKEIFVGREAIGKYWADINAPQSNIHGIKGRPIISGNRAAVEIWVTFAHPGINPKGNHMVTLIETNVLTFAKSGLVSKNVEYWILAIGVHKPPPGWGK